MARGRQPRRRTAVLAALAAWFALTAGASAQSGDGEPGGRGYEDPGYDPDGGDGANAGKVKLTLRAKKEQRSLKAVKVKATCANRSCTVETKGKLRAGGDKAKLKPDEETVAAGDTDKMKLKLPKRARRTAKSALRDDEKLTVKVTGRAKGVGGGSRAEASVKVKLKP
jgi:hypothetical protein